LAGSINNNNWVLLSSQVGITTYTTSNPKTFSLYNFTSYNYYRLIVTKTNGDTNLSIAELSFSGSLNTTFANNDKFNLLLYNTNEKQFPSKAAETVTPGDDTLTTSNEIFNVTPSTYYKQTLIANGLQYILYSSSIFGFPGSSQPKSLLFNYDLSDSTFNYGAHWGSNNYVVNSGATLVTFNIGTNSSYYGDWIIVKFPYPIVLTKFRFYNRSSPYISRAPGLWRCYGSVDGVNWTEITDASNTTTSLTSASYTNSPAFYEKILPSLFDIPYLYIGWIVNKLAGADSQSVMLNFIELQIFGKDDIANFYSNTWKPVGNNIYKNYGNVNIGTITDYSPNTILNISGRSSGYPQPLVQITQTGAWDGNYALQVTGYTNFGGLRLNGADTGNTIYQSLANSDMVISQNPANTSGNINLITY
jgi:hypothetical protein